MHVHCYDYVCMCLVGLLCVDTCGSMCVYVYTSVC